MPDSPKINQTLQQLEFYGVRYAFYYRRQTTEPVFFANQETFSSASIIKVPILLAWLALERQGVLSRNELCNLNDEDQVKGAGLAWQLQTRTLTYADVLLLMIALSDNLCTNLVIRRVGLERLNQVFRQELGLNGTQLQRKLMDFEARARGLDNFISASDCIRLFDRVRALPAGQKEWALSTLHANVDDFLFLRYQPRDGVTFYHKTGSIPGVSHDWGLTDEVDLFLLSDTSQAPQAEQVLFHAFGELGSLLNPQ